MSVAKKLKGGPQKVLRAQILLKSDIAGPNWTDKKIAETFNCRTKTVENVRKRLVTEGFDTTLNGKKREAPPEEKFLMANRKQNSLLCAWGTPCWI